jgi:hypothetical protein
MSAWTPRNGSRRDLPGLALVPVLLLGVVLLSTSAHAAILFDATGYALGASSASVGRVVSADLDHDGDLDLVTSSNAGEITAWENDRSPYDGVWASHALGTAPAGDMSLAVADLDRDGWVDLVSGDGAGQITVWRNDGTPFDGAWPSNTIASLGSNAIIAVGDLDRDSWMDIACVAPAYGPSGNVTIWRNDATPFDGAWVTLSAYSGYALGAIAISDLDLDGSPDIVFTHSERYAAALRNDGTPFDGGWAYNYVGYAGYGMVTGLAAADLDSDGYPDLATACGYAPTEPQWVWWNDHTPFSGGWSSNVYGSSPAPAVAAADLDLDGPVDLITGSQANEDFEVIGWGNDGTPFVNPWLQVDIGATGSASVRAVTPADLDGDGDLDIVSASTTEAQFEIMAWRNLAAPAIVCDPDPRNLTFAHPAATVDVKYVGGATRLLYGYSLKFTWNGTKASTAWDKVTQGTLLSGAGSTFFNARSTGANEITVDCVHRSRGRYEPRGYHGALDARQEQQRARRAA